MSGGIFLNIASDIMFIAHGFQTRLQTSSKTDHTVTFKRRGSASIPISTTHEFQRIALLFFIFWHELLWHGKVGASPN